MKQNIEIQFDTGFKYIISTEDKTNKNFYFCCDLLKLKEYKEFEKKIKNEYWSLDNCLMVRETINSDDLDLFKYILKYINITNMGNIICYCRINNKINIYEYLYNLTPNYIITHKIEITCYVCQILFTMNYTWECNKNKIVVTMKHKYPLCDCCCKESHNH